MVNVLERFESEVKRLLDVPAAARREGKNPETVRRWLREGKLPGRQVFGRWLIDPRDLDQMNDA